MAVSLRRTLGAAGVAAILAQQVLDAQAMEIAAAQEQGSAAEQPSKGMEMQPWHWSCSMDTGDGCN